MSNRIRVPLVCSCGNRDDTDIGALPCSAECGEWMTLGNPDLVAAEAEVERLRAEIGQLYDRLQHAHHALGVEGAEPITIPNPPQYPKAAP